MNATTRRRLRATTWLSLTATAGIVALGIAQAVTVDPVYGPPSSWRIERIKDATDPDGKRERVTIDLRVRKNANCALENGEGIPTVSFYDADIGVPPPSALFRPDGMPSGRTRAKGGEDVVLKGYSAIVPETLKRKTGLMIIAVPCQLYTEENGARSYGRKTVATFGPLTFPARVGEVEKGAIGE